MRGVRERRGYGRPAVPGVAGAAFARAFSVVVFAVTDWSPERRFIGPFERR